MAIAHRSGSASPAGNWLPEAQNDYLRFFVFYGMIFPGIVAAFMLTGKTFTLIRVALFILVALLSLPLLEIGYLGGAPWLSVLPVVVFIVWVFADKTKPSDCHSKA